MAAPGRERRRPKRQRQLGGICRRLSWRLLLLMLLLIFFIVPEFRSPPTVSDGVPGTTPRHLVPMQAMRMHPACVWSVALGTHGRAHAVLYLIDVTLHTLAPVCSMPTYCVVATTSLHGRFLRTASLWVCWNIAFCPWLTAPRHSMTLL